ncbi:CreA family protein [Psychromonas sp. CNPT3]|uniref:CreA family protein n=1 Tax=Psychromonas sp. CNPT3 TaxID=314282 RepID=UPI00006E915D|nr:CreA family protein [Psychromonas sp. CNPT3]
MLKKIKRYALLVLILILLIIGLLIYQKMSRDNVGNISLGIFTTQDIKINILKDPLVTGVTCHIASIEDDLSFSDPSDSAISCRQTGDISKEMIQLIDKSKSGEIVFKKSKSIFFKNMKIRRIYDAKNQTLMYVSYSTKETSGSFKHSLSTVPLWGSQAYMSVKTEQ